MFLSASLTGGVGDLVADAGRHLGPQYEVDESVGLFWIGRIRRDRHQIEPHLGALLGNAIFDIHAVAGFAGPCVGLQNAAGLGDRHGESPDPNYL